MAVTTFVQVLATFYSTIWSHCSHILNPVKIYLDEEVREVAFL